MIFDYNSRVLTLAQIDIEDIGNCSLECSNDDGAFFYYITRTSLGSTLIVTCGPIVPDIPILPDEYQLKVKRMDYKEPKICNDIQKFLNGKNLITKVEKVTYEYAINSIVDIKNYLKRYGEGEIY